MAFLGLNSVISKRFMTFSITIMSYKDSFFAVSNHCHLIKSYKKKIVFLDISYNNEHSTLHSMENGGNLHSHVKKLKTQL